MNKMMRKVLVVLLATLMMVGAFAVSTSATTGSFTTLTVVANKDWVENTTNKDFEAALKAFAESEIDNLNSYTMDLVDREDNYKIKLSDYRTAQAEYDTASADLETAQDNYYANFKTFFAAFLKEYKAYYTAVDNSAKASQAVVTAKDNIYNKDNGAEKKLVDAQNAWETLLNNRIAGDPTWSALSVTNALYQQKLKDYKENAGKTTYDAYVQAEADYNKAQDDYAAAVTAEGIAQAAVTDFVWTLLDSSKADDITEANLTAAALPEAFPETYTEWVDAGQNELTFATTYAKATELPDTTARKAADDEESNKQKALVKAKNAYEQAKEIYENLITKVMDNVLDPLYKVWTLSHDQKILVRDYNVTASFNPSTAYQKYVALIATVDSDGYEYTELGNALLAVDEIATLYTSFINNSTHTAKWTLNEMTTLKNMITKCSSDYKYVVRLLSKQDSEFNYNTLDRDALAEKNIILADTQATDEIGTLNVNYETLCASIDAMTKKLSDIKNELSNIQVVFRDETNSKSVFGKFADTTYDYSASTRYNFTKQEIYDVIDELNDLYGIDLEKLILANWADGVYDQTAETVAEQDIRAYIGGTMYDRLVETVHAKDTYTDSDAEADAKLDEIFDKLFTWDTVNNTYVLKENALLDNYAEVLNLLTAASDDGYFVWPTNTYGIGGFVIDLYDHDEKVHGTIRNYIGSSADTFLKETAYACFLYSQFDWRSYVVDGSGNKTMVDWYYIGENFKSTSLTVQDCDKYNVILNAVFANNEFGEVWFVKNMLNNLTKENVGDHFDAMTYLYQAYYALTAKQQTYITAEENYKLSKTLRPAAAEYVFDTDELIYIRRVLTYFNKSIGELDTILSGLTAGTEEYNVVSDISLYMNNLNDPSAKEAAQTSLNNLAKVWNNKKEAEEKKANLNYLSSLLSQMIQDYENVEDPCYLAQYREYEKYLEQLTKHNPELLNYFYESYGFRYPIVIDGTSTRVVLDAEAAYGQLKNDIKSHQDDLADLTKLVNNAWAYYEGNDNHMIGLIGTVAIEDGIEAFRLMVDKFNSFVNSGYNMKWFELYSNYEIMVKDYYETVEDVKNLLNLAVYAEASLAKDKTGAYVYDLTTAIVGDLQDASAWLDALIPAGYTAKVDANTTAYPTFALLASETKGTLTQLMNAFNASYDDLKEILESDVLANRLKELLKSGVEAKIVLEEVSKDDSVKIYSQLVDYTTISVEDVDEGQAIPNLFDNMVTWYDGVTAQLQYVLVAEKYINNIDDIRNNWSSMTSTDATAYDKFVDIVTYRANLGDATNAVNDLKAIKAGDGTVTAVTLLDLDVAKSSHVEYSYEYGTAEKFGISKWKTTTLTNYLWLEHRTGNYNAGAVLSFYEFYQLNFEDYNDAAKLTVKYNKFVELVTKLENYKNANGKLDLTEEVVETFFAAEDVYLSIGFKLDNLTTIEHASVVDAETKFREYAIEFLPLYKQVVELKVAIYQLPDLTGKMNANLGRTISQETFSMLDELINGGYLGTDDKWYVLYNIITTDVNPLIDALQNVKGFGDDIIGGELYYYMQNYVACAWLNDKNQEYGAMETFRQFYQTYYKNQDNVKLTKALRDLYENSSYKKVNDYDPIGTEMLVCLRYFNQYNNLADRISNLGDNFGGETKIEFYYEDIFDRDGETSLQDIADEIFKLIKARELEAKNVADDFREFFNEITTEADTNELFVPSYRTTLVTNASIHLLEDVDINSLDYDRFLKLSAKYNDLDDDQKAFIDTYRTVCDYICMNNELTDASKIVYNQIAFIQDKYAEMYQQMDQELVDFTAYFNKNYYSIFGTNLAETLRQEAVEIFEFFQKYFNDQTDSGNGSLHKFMDKIGKSADYDKLIEDYNAFYTGPYQLLNLYDTVKQHTEQIKDLQTKLADEIANRDAADQAIIDDLEKEIAAREEAIDNLQQQINDLSTKHAEDVADLTEDLNDEISAREALEKKLADLQTKLDTLDNTTVTGLSNKLLDEIAAREKAVAELKTALEKADADIKAALDQEIADRKTAIDNTNKAITDAKTALEAKDTELAKAIEDAKTASDKADADLKTELTKAIEDACKELETKIDNLDTTTVAGLTAAVEKLQTALEAADKAEAEAREAADEALEAADKAEAEAREAADQALSAEIAALKASLAETNAQVEDLEGTTTTLLILVIVAGVLGLGGVGLGVFILLKKKETVFYPTNIDQ